MRNERTCRHEHTSWSLTCQFMEITLFWFCCYLTMAIAVLIFVHYNFCHLLFFIKVVHNIQSDLYTGINFVSWNLKKKLFFSNFYFLNENKKEHVSIDKQILRHFSTKNWNIHLLFKWEMIFKVRSCRIHEGLDVNK